jgi:hypothetical protein
MGYIYLSPDDILLVVIGLIKLNIILDTWYERLDRFDN